MTLNKDIADSLNNILENFKGIYEKLKHKYTPSDFLTGYIYV